MAVAAFVVWTLAPFELRPPDTSELLAVALDDLVGNLLVAVPIGWLLAASIGPRWAVLAMAAVSMGVESSQLVLATRSPALSDVAANTLGATAGVLWWHRPHARRIGDAMLVAVACWAVATRHSAPGRPVLALSLLMALGMAHVRQEPGRSPDAAGFALVACGGLLGLSPRPLALASLAAVAAGALLASPLRRHRRWLLLAIPIAWVAETWPPFRVAAARGSDPPLMVVEATLLAAAWLRLSLPAGPSARGASCSPAPSSE